MSRYDYVEELERELDEARRQRSALADALGGLGAIGGGYCFCSRNRDPDKVEHEPECRIARDALSAMENRREEA